MVLHCSQHQTIHSQDVSGQTVRPLLQYTLLTTFEVWWVKLQHGSCAPRMWDPIHPMAKVGREYISRAQDLLGLPPAMLALVVSPITTGLVTALHDCFNRLQEIQQVGVLKSCKIGLVLVCHALRVTNNIVGAITAWVSALWCRKSKW